MGLIVDRVEDRDEVVGVLHIELRHVLLHEAGVGEAHPFGLRAPGGDALVGEVVAREAAVGESLRHQVDRVTGAAGDVRHVDARRQLFGEAGHER